MAETVKEVVKEPVKEVAPKVTPKCETHPDQELPCGNCAAEAQATRFNLR